MRPKAITVQTKEASDLNSPEGQKSTTFNNLQPNETPKCKGRSQRLAHEAQCLDRRAPVSIVSSHFVSSLRSTIFRDSNSLNYLLLGAIRGMAFSHVPLWLFFGRTVAANVVVEEHLFVDLDVDVLAINKRWLLDFSYVSFQRRCDFRGLNPLNLTVCNLLDAHQPCMTRCDARTQSPTDR